MECPHCDADLSENIPNFGPVEKWFSCPECGGRVGCKVYYDGRDPRDGLPPGAMGMLQRRDGGIDIAVGNCQSNTAITGGQRQLNAVARAHGQQSAKKLARQKQGVQR